MKSATHTEIPIIYALVQVTKFSKSQGTNMRTIRSANRFQAVIEAAGKVSTTVFPEGEQKKGDSMDQEESIPPETNG